MALLAIGAATLTPQRSGTPMVPWYLPFTGAGDGADALLNTLLFVPLGIALAIVGRPRGWGASRTVAIALATTVTVELLQGLVVPGRQASIGDVLTNTAGAWLGHLLTPALVAACRADGRLARRLAAAYGTTWLVATIAGAALLRPALPSAEAERARCGPERDVPDCFPGRLTGPIRLRQPGRADVAIVDGARVAVGREAAIVADVVDGGRTIRPGRIGGLATGRGSALLTLEQGDHWLVLHARTRGARLGLRSPAAVMPHVLGRPGHRVVAVGGVTGNVRWIEVGARRAELHLSSAEGWRLLFPWSAAAAVIIRTVGGLFHAIALLPLAWWVARAVPRRATRPALVACSVVLAATVVAFGGAAAALDLAAPTVSDWLGALGGGVAGALLAGRARR